MIKNDAKVKCLKLINKLFPDFLTKKVEPLKRSREPFGGSLEFKVM